MFRKIAISFLVHFFWSLLFFDPSAILLPEYYEPWYGNFFAYVASRPWSWVYFLGSIVILVVLLIFLTLPSSTGEQLAELKHLVSELERISSTEETALELLETQALLADAEHTVRIQAEWLAELQDAVGILEEEIRYLEEERAYLDEPCWCAVTGIAGMSAEEIRYLEEDLVYTQAELVELSQTARRDRKSLRRMRSLLLESKEGRAALRQIEVLLLESEEGEAVLQQVKALLENQLSSTHGAS